MQIKKILTPLLALLCASVLLVLGVFLFQNNSPLYQTIGADNAIFLSMGRGIAQGKVPYVDMTENKGPLYFLLMAIPQMLIEGTTGVFLLEELLLLGNCLLIILCARWLTGRKNWTLTAVCGVAALLLLSNGGNFCEEYDLFFLLMGATVIVHTFTNQQNGQSWRAFWLGVATAGIALIKISDIPGLGAAVAAYLIWVIKNKRSIVRETLMYLAGIAVVAVPVFVYLGSVGAIDAMFEEYILNNFVHVAKGKDVDFLSSRMYLLKIEYGRKALLMAGVLIASAVICVLLERRKASKGLCWFAVFFALGNLATAFVASSGFGQHLMMGHGSCILAVLLLVSTGSNMLSGKAGKWLCMASVVLSCAVVAFMGSKIDPESWVTGERYQEHLAYQQELAVDLEGYEDSVFTIGVYPEWYWENGLLPAYRYFNIVGFIVDNVGDSQAEDFEEYMLSGELQALVIQGDLEQYRGVLTNDTIDWIYENYVPYTSDSEGARDLWLMI